MGKTTFSGPVEATNGMYAGAGSLVTLDAATAAVTPVEHAGRTLKLSRAAGVTATLPAATGTGHTYKFFVAVAASGGSYVIRVTGNDTMRGNAIVANDTDNSASIFEAGATADTITLNGTTTGGLIGDIVELQDVAADLWSVRVTSAATGNEATPFSAAVS